MMWNIFSFETSDGLKLYGGLIKAKKPTKKLLIHTHGMTSFFFDGDLILSGAARAANSAGYDLLAFNNRGMGSVSLIGKKFYGTSLEKFEECIQDIDAAIGAARDLGYTEIILSGHSTGCQKVTYYQARKRNPHVKALVLLSPADDLNFHKKFLGKDFSKLLKKAEKLTKQNKGDTILPKEFKTAMFSAQRFYHLLKENSIEGNIFNYEKPLHALVKIDLPVLAIFGSEEQYRAMDPDLMLSKIAGTCTNKKSRTRLIDGGDHSFHGKEKQIAQALKSFLTSV